MNKEIIEKYIQFAIDNWFKNPNIKLKQYVYWNNVLEIDWICPNVIQIITSKEFIGAIVKGLCKDFCITENYDNIIKDKIKRIIIHQAKAIAEFEWDNLEEFITNLWIWQENN